MQFAYQFTDGVCYQVATGKCSLDEDFDETLSEKITKDKANRNYCQRLYAALLKDEVRFKDISIHKTECGHYDFTNGRHRICISQRKGLTIEAEISKGTPLCIDCEHKNIPENLNEEEKANYTIIINDWEEE